MTFDFVKLLKFVNFLFEKGIKCYFCGVLSGKVLFFLMSLTRLHSLTDRMEVSGTSDSGSIPLGATKTLMTSWLSAFFYILLPKRSPYFFQLQFGGKGNFFLFGGKAVCTDGDHRLAQWDLNFCRPYFGAVFTILKVSL